MKRCPECRRDYYDDTLLYCLDDGNALLEGPASADEPKTAILPSNLAAEAATRSQVLTTDKTAVLPSSVADVPKAKSFDKRLLLAPLAIAVIVAGGFFGYRYFQAINKQSIGSIAVLPFENSGSDADRDYLADGLSESLIYRLSQLPSLKVSPTSSVFRYKGKTTDPSIVAKELGVDSVMTGRISQRGDNMTISVNLVDTRNGKSLWGEQYERKLSELLATQRDIAIEITNKLQLKLSGDGEQKLAKKYTDNNDAYQLYLKGNFYVSQYTKESLATGAEYYNQAIALDPNYALAYNGLAYYYIVADDFYLSPSESMPKARVAAKRALEIDETLADAHTSLAVVLHWYDWDWAAAENEFRRAIELNPNDSRTRQDYSWFLVQVGRTEEAIAEGKKAQQIDPLSPEVGIFLGMVFNFARRNDEAIEQLRKTVELDPKYWVAHDDLGRAYEQKGDINQAMAEYQRARQLEKNVPEILALVGRANALLGKKAEAQKVIDELKEVSKRMYVPPYNFAIIFAGLGDKDKAFEYLNRAYDERSYYLTWLKVDSQLDNLRNDPRFKELIRKVGIPE